MIWTEPQEIATRQGLKLVQYAYPDSDFWTQWRLNKSTMKESGISISKFDGTWRASKWSNPKTEAPIVQLMDYEIKFRQGLLAYQVPHVSKLVSIMHQFGSVLDTSHTGTGKTFTSIALARELGLIPAIVCPKSVITNWQKVCELFKIKPYFITNWEGCRSKKFVAQGYFDHNDLYQWKLGPQILLIFDEAHKAKAEDSLNAEFVIAAKRQKIKTILLSATLASNPNEMKAAGYTIGLHYLRDFNHWRRELGCYQNKFNGWETSDARGVMKALHDQIFPNKGACMRIEDLGDQFPETQISAECYDIGDKKARELNDRFNELLEQIDELQNEDNAQAKAMVLNLRYRQFAELQKVEALTELAKDYIESGSSVVIFTNFTETLEHLLAKFPKSPFISGQQKTIKERQDAIDRFQADKSRIIIVNIDAGGVGVSLHDLHGNFPRIALICPSYRAVSVKQALGRVHRAGGKTKSIQRLVYAAKTIEEDVARSVNRKIAAIDALNDGDLAEKDLFGLLKNRD